MSKDVDARGLSCPLPIIMAKKAVEAGEFPIEVLVDNVTSRQNVQRVIEGAGYQVDVAEMGDEFKLTIRKRES